VKGEESLGELVFVGLGLHDHLGISLRALEEIRAADQVFIELYTSLLPAFSMEKLTELAGKKPRNIVRKDLEEKNGEAVIEAAERGKAVLLVPGDPLIATTHVALRIAAEKKGIRTRVVHGASIVSAAIGLSGLHNYKFGRSVTIPFPDDSVSLTPYQVIGENKKLGLHTLCLLDIKADERRYLTINDALKQLSKIEAQKKDGVVTEDSVVVGVARAGSNNPVVKAGFVKELLNFDFSEPPHTLLFVGKLHFMETEALITLAGAPEKLRRLSE
jgi:diphthine synthase